MPTILKEIYRIQKQLSGLDAQECLLLKMCANLLEGYHRVKTPLNWLTDEEYFAVPQKWELVDGMLRDYDSPGQTAPNRRSGVAAGTEAA